MLRHVFKAGHAGAVFGTIGALDSALWDIKAKAAGQPLWRLLGGLDRTVPAYASALDIALTEEQLAATYRTYADHGLRVAIKLATPMEHGEGRDRRCTAALMAGRPSPASSSRIAWPRPRKRRGPASSAERRASLHVRAGEQAGRADMVPGNRPSWRSRRWERTQRGGERANGKR
jgi:hypothetical protein